MKPCRACGRQVIIARRAGNRSSVPKWDVVDGEPIHDNQTADERTHRIVANSISWTPALFAETFALRNEVTVNEGRRVARDDWPWHQLHDCPKRGGRR